MDVVSTPRLTLDGADRLITAARAEAASPGVDVVVHACDPGGRPIAIARMDASPTFFNEIAHKKAWTAAPAGAAGVSGLQIGRRIGRAASTHSREPRRNATPDKG